jgi:RimJ/RimL family protein N-acetyltransferase
MSLTFDTFSPSLSIREDAFGNPVGKAIEDWQAREPLPSIELKGRTCRLMPYALEYAQGLYESLAKDDGSMWSYLPYGPFSDTEAIDTSIQNYQRNRDFQTFVILKDEIPVGYASYMRYDLVNGVVEVGGVTFSPALRRSTVATEAMYLMMAHAFAHGYRRYEWKCNQLNAPSNHAALRLGFTFEGVFRNHQVAREGRRDTAWYSVITEEWPQVRGRLESWLDPASFDADGQQKQALSAIRVTRFAEPFQTS